MLSRMPRPSHPESEGSKTCVDELICNAPDYYNYYRNECISDIPEEYYCNSTTDRTIDKCYDRCKKCTQEGNDAQNNCETCKDDYPYSYYNGNCYTSEECNNGVIDSPSKTCKCMEEVKCLKCNSESLSNGNLCESCNTGYYKKKR